MSSIGEIKANAPEHSHKAESSLRKKSFYFGVFFDGTGNNMIQPERAKQLREALKNNPSQDLEVYKNSLSLSDNGGNPLTEIEQNESDFSNVGVLQSSYIALTDEERDRIINDGYDVFCYNIYVEGAGTDEVYTGSKLQKIHNWRGSGFGHGHTGVPQLVETAMRLVQIRINGFEISQDDEIHFDVFGFSRGATCARMFCHLIGEHERLKSEDDFSDLINSDKFLRQFNYRKRTVEFLGIFDTVSSIGDNYDDNTTEYGLYSPNDKWVKRVMHIAALDEYRDHFRLTDIGDAINREGCTEIFIPGCHSDVGGGYKEGKETVAIMYANNRIWTNLSRHLYRVMSGTNNRLIYTTNPQKKKEENLRPVNIETLKLMGWCEDDDKSYWTDRVNGIYNITRNISQGYSNIPLKMMEIGTEKTERTLFKINEERFVVSKEFLPEHQEKMLELAKNNKGRYFYNPPLDEYRNLRLKYIHYSSSDAITRNTSIVHNPTINGRTIVRKVYHGNMGETTVHYMDEYE